MADDDLVPRGTVKDGYVSLGGSRKDRDNWREIPSVGTIKDGYRFKGGTSLEKEDWEAVSTNWPTGIPGSAKAQIAGELHGISEVAGGPIDVASNAVKGAEEHPRTSGLPKLFQPIVAAYRGAQHPTAPDEIGPIGGAKSIRAAMSMPAMALNWLSDKTGGWGKSWGLEGHASYEDINEVPTAYRPQARFGEVLGTTAGMVTGQSLAGRFASAAPVSSGSAVSDVAQGFMAGQGGSQIPGALGAAGGAYGAELMFPGSPLAQTVGQLGGGMGGAALAGAGSAGMGAAKKPLENLVPKHPETAVARALGSEFEKAGESPGEAIRNLRQQPTIPGASPAEQSGSRVLMGVEKTIAENNPDLANHLAKRNAVFQQNINQAVDAAFLPGDRQALTRAAEGLRTQIDSYVTAAETDAMNAAAATRGTVSREVASHEARQILESALQSARRTENQLWHDVPQEVSARATQTVQAFNTIRGEMLPESRLPNLIHRVLERLSDKPDVEFRELQNLRSEILNQARIARAAGDNNNARRLETIGRGALADMSRVENQSAQLARAFSRDLNDRFTRSFAGDILGLKETGAPAVRSSMTLESATSGSPQLVAEKLRDLQRAATNIPPQIGSDGRIVQPAQLSPEMRQVQEQFLQSISARFTDVTTGRIKAPTAIKFLRDYSPVLDQFPIYRQQVENAVTAQLAAEQVAAIVQDASRSAFTSVLEAGEVPMRAVAKALASPTPARSFSELAGLARSSGPQALGGLRATVLDFIMDNATKQGRTDFNVARQALVSPVSPNGVSMLDLMRSNGVLNEQQANTLLERLDAAARHATAFQDALRIDEVGHEASKAVRWTSRILAVKLASKLGFTHGGAGPSLQIANMVASAAEYGVSRLPLNRARAVLAEALMADDPKKLIDILERINTDGVGGAKNVRNVGYLIPLLRTLLPQTQTQNTPIDPRDVAKSRQHYTSKSLQAAKEIGQVGEHADWDQFASKSRPSENVEDARDPTGRRGLAQAMDFEDPDPSKLREFEDSFAEMLESK